jgi:leader peptidase (prepilin peptidase) / N-methyltransferase
MEMLLTQTHLLMALVGLLIGLFVGSFLNVVIYRLPLMLQAQWQTQCQHLLHPDQVVPARPRHDLLLPRSRCVECGHPLRWYENIPLLSYLGLRGQCSVCKASIGLRYPAVELLTGALFAYCGARWGWGWQTAAWCAFCAALVALAFIDWDSTLLPDDITLPLLWLGLMVAALRWNDSLTLIDAFWGAVAAYLSLWSVYWAFKIITGKEGMGHGDFKLFAALGAWLGWQALIPMILLASCAGAAVGLVLKAKGALREGGYLPFGPFLAGAGVLAMMAGPSQMLKALGL